MSLQHYIHPHKGQRMLLQACPGQSPRMLMAVWPCIVTFADGERGLCRLGPVVSDLVDIGRV